TELTGHSPGDVLGTDLGPLLAPEDPKVTELRVAVSQGRSHTATVEARRADGGTFRDRVYVWPVRGPDGEVTHGVGLHLDVTDAEDERARLAESAERERRARAGLLVIAQISDILQDLDDPRLLKQITAVLRQDAVDWVEFFLD